MNSENAPVIPSAQPEVKIRTFASDILSLKESGSGLPQFQAVKVPSGEKTASPVFSPRRSGKVFLIFLGLIVLLAAGYFGYRFLIADRGEGGIPPSPESIPEGQAPPTAVPSALQHQSAFKEAADETLTLKFSIVDSRSYNAKLIAIAGEADSTARFVEVEVQREDGAGAAINEILEAADALVLDKEVWEHYFNPDPTVFVHRERGGAWPGYVLELKSDQNWLFLKTEVAKLEASPKIVNLFYPPLEERGEFYDGMIEDQPVRIADSASGKRFMYGWVRGYLILSTSEAGFREAVLRL